MGIIKETKTHEFHGVKCWRCSEKSIVQLPKEGPNSLNQNDRVFDDEHRFTCGNCRRQKKAQQPALDYARFLSTNGEEK